MISIPLYLMSSEVIKAKPEMMKSQHSDSDSDSDDDEEDFNNRADAKPKLDNTYPQKILRFKLKLALVTIYWSLGFLSVPLLTAAILEKSWICLILWLILIAIKIVAVSILMFVVITLHDQERRSKNYIENEKKIEYYQVDDSIIAWIVEIFYLKALKNKPKNTIHWNELSPERSQSIASFEVEETIRILPTRSVTSPKKKIVNATQPSPSQTPRKVVGTTKTSPAQTPKKVVGATKTLPAQTPKKVVGSTKTLPAQTQKKVVGTLKTSPAPTPKTVVGASQTPSLISNKMVVGTTQTPMISLLPKHSSSETTRLPSLNQTRIGCEWLCNVNFFYVIIRKKLILILIMSSSLQQHLQKENALKIAVIIAGVLDTIFSIRFFILSIPLYIIRSTYDLQKSDKSPSSDEYSDERMYEDPREEHLTNPSDRRLELKLFMVTFYWVFGLVAVPFIILALLQHESKFLVFWLIIIAFKIFAAAALVVTIVILFELHKSSEHRLPYYVDDFVNFSDLTYVLSLIVLWIIVWYYFREVLANSRRQSPHSSDPYFVPRGPAKDDSAGMIYYPREERKLREAKAAGIKSSPSQAGQLGRPQGQRPVAKVGRN
uniref:Uncharacterized protein n=1 Tax=Strigamia maritima TaxID=126957 RepID=T1J9M8_STRMM